jgi:hypothetical protein
MFWVTLRLPVIIELDKISTRPVPWAWNSKFWLVIVLLI